MSRRFADLKAPEVLTRCTGAGVAVLPIGAVEQHGAHLPLSTDLVVVEELCRTVCEDRLDLELWLLPTLAYSKSNEHFRSPGTLWLSAATLLQTIDDIAACLAQTAIRKLVMVNGHGGNSSLLDVACRDVRVRHGLMTFLTHTVLPPDQGGETVASELDLGIHGGEDETSLVLHVAPHLVDMSIAERSIPEWLNRYEHIGISGPVRFGWTADDLSPTGVIGDPTGATVERGKAMFEGMVTTLGAQFAEIAAFEFEEGRG